MRKLRLGAVPVCMLGLALLGSIVCRQAPAQKQAADWRQKWLDCTLASDITVNGLEGQKTVGVLVERIKDEAEVGVAASELKTMTQVRLRQIEGLTVREHANDTYLYVNLNAHEEQSRPGSIVYSLSAEFMQQALLEPGPGGRPLRCAAVATWRIRNAGICPREKMGERLGQALDLYIAVFGIAWRNANRKKAE